MTGARLRALRPAVFRVAARALAAIGAFVVLVTFTPLCSWYSRVLAGPWKDPPGDILIVLSGSSAEGAAIGLNSYWRAVYAARAYREGGFTRVVVCGTPASRQMRDFLVFSGVPARAIRTEELSRNTRENAIFTARLLAHEPGTKVLLTSDYHMYRAHRSFEKAGLKVAPRPFPDAAKRASVSYLARWPVFIEECMETIKIAWYLARGWL